MINKIQKRIFHLISIMLVSVSKKKGITKSSFWAVFAVILFYTGMQLLGITCPIKYLTGISCAGCGMTRAYLSLLRLDFSKAFYYHPLFFLPPIFLVIYVKRASMKKSIYNMFLFLFISIFLVVYLYRMFNAEKTILVCRPEEGLIFRCINIFL